MIEITQTKSQENLSRTLKVLRSLRDTCNYTPICTELDNAIRIVGLYATAKPKYGRATDLHQVRPEASGGRDPEL